MRRVMMKRVRMRRVNIRRVKTRRVKLIRVKTGIRNELRMREVIDEEEEEAEDRQGAGGYNRHN